MSRPRRQADIINAIIILCFKYVKLYMCCHLDHDFTAISLNSPAQQKREEK